MNRKKIILLLFSLISLTTHGQTLDSISYDNDQKNYDSTFNCSRQDKRFGGYVEACFDKNGTLRSTENSRRHPFGSTRYRKTSEIRKYDSGGHLVEYISTKEYISPKNNPKIIRQKFVEYDENGKAVGWSKRNRKSIKCGRPSEF